MELASLLRRTRRNAKSPARIFLLLIAVGVAACSEVPPEYNPVEWSRTAQLKVKNWFSDTPEEPPPIVDPPPSEGRPFPNLGTVPPPPPRDTPETRAERQRQLSALTADRNASVSADTGLRTEGKFPGPPAAPTPAPTAAPAAQSPAARPAEPRAPPGPIDALLSPPVPNLTPAPVTRAPQPPQPGESAVEEPPPAAPARAAPAVAAAAPVPPVAPVLTTSERRGSVSFARAGTVPSSTSQRVLQEAASFAVANAGRVRLVPAQYARDMSSPGQAQARTEAMQRILTGAGLPIDRIAVTDGAAQRADVYDVFVDY
ncbi:MAG TPA: hypothetical protein VGB82_25135 [Alphaproteobacteria bacterium]